MPLWAAPLLILGAYCAVQAAELSAGRRFSPMLWTVLCVLLILWVLGLIGGYTFGGLIHLLLLLAAVCLIVQILTGRRTLE
jgi:hypothetical protein